MIKLQAKNKRNLIACAMGKIEADLCVSNVRLVNVLTGEIYPADVYVYEGYIAHIETINVGKDIVAKEVIDGNGQYMTPGFIDSHVHIESSMLTPRNFAKGVINHGTTTVVTDPHEIANVYGTDAVRYMHDASEDLPMRQLLHVPSCVPAVPGMENSGAEFGPNEITEMAKLERVVGLAEVMDMYGVIHGSDRMMDIVKAAEDAGLFIQGHAPFITGRELSAYAIGGGKSCHESRTEYEFLEKMRIGIQVDVRESSISLNAREGVLGTQGVKFYDMFCVCTDDREADDILHIGHLNVTLRKMIATGLDPVTAIKSATYNNAKQIKLDNLGAIAPGYVADMLLMESLTELAPSKVFFEGKLVSADGKLTVDIEDKEFELETRNSMRLEKPELSKFCYNVPTSGDTVKVNVMSYLPKTPITKATQEEFPVVNGILDISGDKDVKYITVFNRHGKGTIGYGLIRNFGSVKGAVASTVSHDSHNLVVVYDTPENGKAAVDAIFENGGGMAVADEGVVKATLPLVVGGLMSEFPAQIVAEHAQGMKEALWALGMVDFHNPILRIGICALPVIPECKMSDLGLVDVLRKEIIPLYR